MTVEPCCDSCSRARPVAGSARNCWSTKPAPDSAPTEQISLWPSRSCSA